MPKSEAEILDSVMQLTGISSSDLQNVLSYFERKDFKKKTTLITAGETTKEVYLILKGCIRLYHIKEGNDISICFFTEGIFCGYYDSFVSGQPGGYYMETLEDCTVLALSHQNYRKLFDEFPGMQEFTLKIVEERFTAMQQLFTTQLLQTPEERYLQLQKNRPDLLNRIPQHQIATYLGVTPVSLSRIRKRSLKK